MNPVNYAPQLRDTLFRANALAIARQLLGEQATPFFEHAIFKPAGRGAATPWHQDEAYRPEPDYVYRELSIWMPLQDVSVENGCMQFVLGTNRGDVLIHRSANNDPNTHALECCGNFDRTKAVACPLRSGGCTVHDGRTLHYAGPNRTDIPRWAYIVAFDLPPKRRAGKRQFGWNDEKHSADMAPLRVCGLSVGDYLSKHHRSHGNCD